MSPIRVYTSNPADQGLAGFMLALGMNLGREVELRPLSELPPPRPRAGSAVPGTEKGGLSNG